MGSPQTPTPAQYAQLEKAGQLDGDAGAGDASTSPTARATLAVHAAAAGGVAARHRVVTTLTSQPK